MCQISVVYYIEQQKQVKNQSKATEIEEENWSFVELQINVSDQDCMFHSHHSDGMGRWKKIENICFEIKEIKILDTSSCMT